MNLAYTVVFDTERRVYHGFRGVANVPPKVLACVVWDGDCEWWQIDPANVADALAELTRYYRECCQHAAEIKLYRMET